MPTVSILIPAFNVEQYLSRCLESVISQTYRDIQVIVVDDGSKDGTWRILQEFALMDNRIEIYHHENQGVAETRNCLLERIKGEFFLFVDADDWIESDLVEYLVSLMITERSDMALCEMIINDALPSSSIPKVFDLTQEEAVKDFLRHEYFTGSLCNKLIRRSLLQNNPRFCRKVSYGEDALFVWEILQGVQRVVTSDKELYHYRMNATSLSHTQWSPEKKGSNHIVWSLICRGCEILWPEYYDLAKTRYAIADMWGLWFALQTQYPFDDHIKARQYVIRDNLRLVMTTDLLPLKTKLLCVIVAYFYRLSYLFSFLIGKSKEMAQ